ncbi:hypothetical protein BH10PSE14_BH10PSE14_17870 [soil metagenome]
MAVAMLGLGVGLVASPVAAKDKDKDKPSTISMSEAFRLGARQAQALLATGDATGAAPQVSALQPSTPLETYIAAGLRMELASRRGDPQAQRKALTDMLESNAVPEGQEAYLRFLAGYYSYYLGVYDDAIAQVNYARKMGYAGVDTTMVLADSMIKKNRGAEGLTMLEQAMEQQKAAGKPIPATWFDRALAISYQSGNWNNVATWCKRKLELYPTAENWRSCLANYLAAPNVDAQNQLDLYRLQAATGAMASERDYQTYASLAATTGFEAEAKAIIESGRAKGKLAPTETVTAGLLKSVTPKAAKSIAALPAQAKKAAAASTGTPALALGDTYFSLGQFPQAATQYRLALSKGGVDAARVNSRLGVALARSGDLPGGRAALAQVSGSSTNVAGFWTTWLNQQPSATASVATPAPTS